MPPGMRRCRGPTLLAHPVAGCRTASVTAAPCPTAVTARPGRDRRPAAPGPAPPSRPRVPAHPRPGRRARHLRRRPRTRRRPRRRPRRPAAQPRVSPRLVPARRTSGMGEWDTGRVRSRVVTRSASAWAAVARVSSRLRCACTSGRPLASHPSRAVAHRVGLSQLLGRVRRSPTPCDSPPQGAPAASDHSIATPLATSPHPVRRRHTPPCRGSPAPRSQSARWVQRRPHRQPDALATSTGSPHRAPQVRVTF